MATKKLQSIRVHLCATEGTVTGVARGEFTVEDVASCSEFVDLSEEVSVSAAKALVIAQAEEGGHTGLDETS